MFMVRGSRLMLSFGFKVTVFHWKNNSMGFLLGQTTRWLNVIYESRVKWTWHHSNFAIHEVSFYHRLKVVLLQLLPIHVGAVGIRDLDFMLLCWKHTAPYIAYRVFERIGSILRTHTPDRQLFTMMIMKQRTMQTNEFDMFLTARAFKQVCTYKRT